MTRSTPAGTSKPTDQWAALLQKEMMSTGRLPPGEGWYTLQELRKSHGGSEKQVRTAVNKLVERGQAERFAGSKPGPSGLPRQCVWYRLKS